MSGTKACRAQTKDMSCILCYTIVTFVTFDLECDVLRSSPKHITLPANKLQECIPLWISPPYCV